MIDMRKTVFMIVCMAALSGCIREKAVMTEPAAVNYIPVGVSLVQDSGDTKSLASLGSEEFKSAILYAISPSSGSILTYGSNAGDLSGTPVWISTDSKVFSWPLPVKTALTIYCIVNPPDGFGSGVATESITESYLTEQYYSFNGSNGLLTIENEGRGLPMAGIQSVGSSEITTDNASLSVSVKYLFAKYSFSLDLSGLEEGESISVTKLAINKGNTRVPYFQENYKQTNVSYLKDADYATEAQLTRLSKGGSQNCVDIYALENCHGTHSGASSWWTVYSDLYGSWPEIAKCTSVQLSYNITGPDGTVRSYLSRIYLGSGNMVSDFNLKRNLYKCISVKASRRTGESDPFFRFAESSFVIAPGTEKTIEYGSNIYECTSMQTSPSVWITDMLGNSSSKVTVVRHSPLSNTAVLRAAVACESGEEYLLCGGCQGAFNWPPYGTKSSAVIEKVKLKIIEARTLSFTAPQGDIYPYQEAVYLSSERFTQAVAQEMAASVRITSIIGSVDHEFTSVGIQEINGEYAVRLTLVPDRPGTIRFNAQYGEAGDSASGPSVIVQTPVLAAFITSDAVSYVHTDVLGNAVNLRWALMPRNYSTLSFPLENPISGGEFTLSKKDAYGTRLSAAISGSGNSIYSNTVKYATIRVEGFDGLPGFDEDNYSFNGISIDTEGRFTYRSGYTVTNTVQIILDNPLAGYSYDGKTCEYAVYQGRTVQPSFVSVTQSSYIVENMLAWPQREFSIDLTRSGTRACNGLDVWSDHSSISSVSQFTPVNGILSGIKEDLRRWGPVFFGRRLENSVSGETRRFIHSVIRFYSCFNVFATFDVQEKNKVKVNWDNLAGVDWNPIQLGNYHFGGFKVTVTSNFDLGDYALQMNSLVQKDISASTRVMPVFSGFSLDTSGNKPFHGTYSAGAHNAYQCYSLDAQAYMLGYYIREQEPLKYDIYYDWIFVDGSDDDRSIVNWRLIAAQNKPWFKAGSGGCQTGGRYITPLKKNASGDYCFNVLASSANQKDYDDPDGYGYLRFALFWEGKDGRYAIGSKALNPKSSFDASLTLVNGWYDPTPYVNGVPIPAENVGMYFFPNSTSATGRSGYPGYYSYDWPYNVDNGGNHGKMEIGTFSYLEYGELMERDINAAR